MRRPKDFPQDIIDTFVSWCREKPSAIEDVCQELDYIESNVMRLALHERGYLISLWLEN